MRNWILILTLLVLTACGGGGGGGSAPKPTEPPPPEDTIKYTWADQKWCHAVLKTVHNGHRCSHWNFSYEMAFLPRVNREDIDYAKSLWYEDWRYMQLQRDMCFKMIEFRPGWSRRRTSHFRFRDQEVLRMQTPMVEAGLVYGPVEPGSAEDKRISAEVNEMLKCYSDEMMLQPLNQCEGDETIGEC